MEAINYILTSIVISIFPFVGFFIAKETEEELATGKKYFKIISLISFIAAFTIPLFYHFSTTLYLPIFICSVLAVLFSYLVYKNKNFDYYLSSFAAIAFFLAKNNETVFYYVSGLLIVMFISIASLITSEKILQLKGKKRSILKTIGMDSIIFIFLSLALFYFVR